MKEKSLRDYLAKAKYLLVFIKNPVSTTTASSYRGVHIPSINISNILRASNLGRNNSLQRPLSRKEQVDKLKRLLFSSKTAQISLIKDSQTVNTKAFKAARATSSVSKNQDLHLLNIGMIYYANRHKAKSINGWKVPCLVHVTKQFQSVLKAPLIKPSKTTIRKYRLISTLKGELLEDKEASEYAQKGNLALEKEYSHRRNYRTSRPLYT